MLVSYKWLQEYIDLTGISAVDLAEKITRSGIEVDSVTVLNEGIKGVIVGHVLQSEQHPNADKLKKCLVDVGKDVPVQIICGAANVAEGQKVAVAVPGAVLPGNFKIKKTKLRGEESNGMICSLQELGIEGKLVQKEYADGIFVFPNDAKVGVDALSLLNRDDTVLEFDLTPNRADCLSMLGVAYEVAAVLEKEVRLPKVEQIESNEKAEDYITVRVDAPEDNPLYVAKVIKNVKIGPSPLWMQTRLMAAGIRPHNNVVDITNYILLEYGQPLHAFDYDRLGSKEIVVRRAHEGEKMVTLDEVERTLTNDHLVITNGDAPVAMAGVMGGANSEVQEDTTVVLLESAYFAGQTVRKASKDHGLRSEASNRYEKGIDPKRVREAAERAAQLMQKYAHGDVLAGTSEVDTMQIEEKEITITLEKINRVLGMGLRVADVEDVFARLQFGLKTVEETFTVTVPTRRGDVVIEEDLIEEVARIYGYDRIPTTLPVAGTTEGKLSPYQKKRRAVRAILEGAGCFEAITYSLTNEKKATQYALEVREPVQLSMPMSEDRSRLRLSIVPHLLEVLQHNVARKINDVAVYEIGSVFLANEIDALPTEEEHVAGAFTGLWSDHAWQGTKITVDFFVVKGILEGLFHRLGVEEEITYVQTEMEGMHPGRTASINLNGEQIGFVGQIHPTVEQRYDLHDTYVFELNLMKLLNQPVADLHYVAIPRYPAITRDIALVVEQTLSAYEVETIIKEAGGRLLHQVQVFDVYEGAHIEAGKKSIAFKLVYLDPDHTLTDEEVTKTHQRVLQTVEKKTGAVLRD